MHGVATGAIGVPVIFVLVALTLIPFVHADTAWFDSAHLSAAAAGLGVPHPTGFPLFCILGYAAHLIPIGSVPFKIALLSTLCNAGAAALVYRTLIDNRVPAWMAVAGVVSLVANYVVFLNGSLAEVYSVTLLWLAGLFALLVRPAPRWNFAGFWTGLGLGAHVTFWMFAALVWVLTAARGRRWREFGQAVGWGVFGASIVAYLPLAASRDPWLNWGDPSSLGALIDHLSASSIRTSFSSEMLSGAGWTEHASAWLEAAGGPLWPLWAPLLGAGLWAPERRDVWLAAVSLLVVDLTYATLINPMGLGELQNGTPGALALAFVAPLGLCGLGRRFGRAAAVGGGTLVATMVAVGAIATGAQRAPDDLAGRWARLVLADPLPGSLTITASDHLAGHTIYLRGVEGYRVDLDSRVAQNWDDPSRLVAHALPDQPAFWQLGDGYADRGVRGHLTPARWLYRVSAKPVEAPRLVVSGYLDDVAALTRVAEPGFRSRRVFSNAARLRATEHLLRGDTPSGGQIASLAVRLDPTNEKGLLTLAVALARSGALPRAVTLLERAVVLAPRYAIAWKNLARFRAEIGDAEGASEARQRWEQLRGSR